MMTTRRTDRLRLRRRVAAAAGALALFSVVLGGCGGPDGDGDGSAATGPTVVASTFALFEAASEVAGDRAQVTNLVTGGGDHDLELSPDQVADLEDADLALVMGDGFQPAVERVAGRRDGPTVTVLDGEDDPHVWLDPRRMKAITEQVASRLAEIDADGAETYRAEAARFGAELDALHGRMEAGLTGCRRTTLVTAHAAFGHLASAYGLDQEAIAGFDPSAEPAPARLDELVEVVRRTGTTTVFSETLAAPEVAETLAREAGVSVAVLDPIEGLTGDQAAAGLGYIELMDANLAALRPALGCP